MERVPFDRQDMRQGDSGAWYSLRALEALARAGRLVQGSEGWLVLQAARAERAPKHFA